MFVGKISGYSVRIHFFTVISYSKSRINFHFDLIVNCTSAVKFLHCSYTSTSELKFTYMKEHQQSSWIFFFKLYQWCTFTGQFGEWQIFCMYASLLLVCCFLKPALFQFFKIPPGLFFKVSARGYRYPGKTERLVLNPTPNVDFFSSRNCNYILAMILEFNETQNGVLYKQLNLVRFAIKQITS